MVYSHTLIGKKYLLTQSGNRWWQRSYTLVPINMFYLPLLKISFVGPRNLKEFFCSSPPHLWRLFLRSFKVLLHFSLQSHQCNRTKVLASICQKKIVNKVFHSLPTVTEFVFSTLAPQHANTIIKYGYSGLGKVTWRMSVQLRQWQETFFLSLQTLSFT